MLAKLPNRFVAGETADPNELNENFGYTQALLNGGLDANNLAKTARITRAQTRNYWTPAAYTFYLGVDNTAPYNRAEVQLPVGANCRLSHAEYSYIDTGSTTGFEDGRSYYLGPIRESDAIVLVVDNTGTDIWTTTYDVTVPPNTYVWGKGQAIIGQPQDIVVADTMGVRVSSGSAAPVAEYLCVRVWLYWEQEDISANSPKTDSLTRNILPPELD